jgi:hypothetical protein
MSYPRGIASDKDHSIEQYQDQDHGRQQYYEEIKFHVNLELLPIGSMREIDCKFLEMTKMVTIFNILSIISRAITNILFFKNS